MNQPTFFTDDELANIAASTAESKQEAWKLEKDYAQLKKRQVVIPSGVYRVVYADPPWSYGKSFEPSAIANGAFGHYPTMTTQSICEMTLPSIAEDAVLFLWAVSPQLPEALQVISAWGFTYKTAFIWDKLKHNMGHYSSVRHELLLLATKGSCTPDSARLEESVVALPRTEHSRKPEFFRDLIDRMYPLGDRVELFARGTLPAGWAGYGNQYVEN